MRNDNSLEAVQFRPSYQLSTQRSFVFHDLPHYQLGHLGFRTRDAHCREQQTSESRLFADIEDEIVQHQRRTFRSLDDECALSPCSAFSGLVTDGRIAEVRSDGVDLDSFLDLAARSGRASDHHRGVALLPWLHIHTVKGAWRDVKTGPAKTLDPGHLRLVERYPAVNDQPL